MSAMRQSFLVHVCALSNEERQSLEAFPSRTDHWWEKFARYRTVYKTTTTGRYFRSNRAFVQEVRRHIRNRRYRFTYHPLSRIALYQDVVMFFVWTAALVLGGLEASFIFKSYFVGGDEWPVSTFAMRTLRLVVAVDIILRFFRGYMIDKTRETVLDPAKIRRNYLKTYFFADLCVPLVWILAHSVPGGLYFRMVLYQFNYLVIVRMRTIVNTCDMLLKKLRFHKYFRLCVELFMVTMLCIHCWSCVLKVITLVYDMLKLSRFQDSWYSKYLNEIEVLHIGQLDDSMDHMEFIEEYLVHFSMAGTYFLGVNWNRYASDDSIEMFITSLILITGLMLYVSTMARVSHLFSEINISARLYEELIEQATNHMIRSNYPRPLRRRILKYYSYKFDRNFFHEDIIMDGLSEHLRMEVVLYSSIHLIHNLNAFKGLSRATIGSILVFLKPEIYLTKDTIMRVDDDEKKIFFVVYGTCSVQLMNNKEMIHCEDGDVFSNAWNQITGTEAVAFLYRIVAAEPCQIFTMKMEDLTYCCKQYPGLLDRLNQVVSVGIQRFYGMYSAAVSPEEDVRDSNILQQLRRKQILDHGTRRRDFA